MMEVEAKLRLRDEAGLRHRLARLGAVPQGSMAQEDVLMGHPCRDLRATDEALRVRRDGTTWELTYKGPRQPGAVKARREVNVACSADPAPVLEAMGFTPRVHVRKRRESWSLGPVTVCIDAVEGLGVFAEVEALADDVEAARRQVEEALRDLGLAGEPREARAYAQMLADDEAE